MGPGDPSNMVCIPDGGFLMGSDQPDPEERPAHPVAIDGFWMDVCAVTNAEFAAFVEATGFVGFHAHRWSGRPAAPQPVVGLDPRRVLAPAGGHPSEVILERGSGDAR